MNYYKRKFYYEIIKSWWEVFPDGSRFRMSSIIRNRDPKDYSRYKTYEDAHKVAIKFRKSDPTYRYDLGDRIYVRKYYE